MSNPDAFKAAMREEDLSRAFTPTPYNNGDLPEDIYPEQSQSEPSTPAICKEVVYEDEGEEYSDDD